AADCARCGVFDRVRRIDTRSAKTDYSSIACFYFLALTIESFKYALNDPMIADLFSIGIELVAAALLVVVVDHFHNTALNIHIRSVRFNERLSVVRLQPPLPLFIGEKNLLVPQLLLLRQQANVLVVLLRDVFVDMLNVIGSELPFFKSQSEQMLGETARQL